jgi:hypothetical protein
MINIDDVMRYEAGLMDRCEAIEFIASLVKSGDAWRLQGSYGRTARALIEAGLISSDGVVL